METTTDTKTREVWIPTVKLGAFKERVRELNKRASRLKSDPIEYTVTNEKSIEHVPAEQSAGFVNPAYNYEVTKVIVEGKTPRLNGWIVAGKIEHDPELDTNIIYEFGDSKVPEEFRKKEGCCDHCGVNRPRSKTYILKKDEDTKQVGSSCLKDFTGHANPENACNITMFINECMDEMDAWDKSFGTIKGYIAVEPFLNQVAELVLQEGYISARKAEETMTQCTADGAREIYLDADNPKFRRYKPTDQAISLAKEAIEYIKSLDRDNHDNYVNNLITFTHSGMVKEKYTRYLGSAIYFYQNEMEKKNRQAEDMLNKTHIGTEGEKHCFNATLKGIYKTDSEFGTIHIHKFRDDDGNNITWYSGTGANIEIDEKYKITATIKKHDYYRDIPCTVIIRPKCEILKDLLPQETIDHAKELAERIGDFKGPIALNKYRETLYPENYTYSYPQYDEGVGKLITYLSYDKGDKISRQIADLNTHQILLLSTAMVKTGYTICSDTREVKKFFKNNQAIVDKIAAMYEVKKEKKKRQSLSM